MKKKTSTQINPIVLAGLTLLTVFSIWNAVDLSLVTWTSNAYSALFKQLDSSQMTTITKILAGVLVIVVGLTATAIVKAKRKIAAMKYSIIAILINIATMVATLQLPFSQIGNSLTATVALMAWIALAGLTIVKAVNNFQEDRDGGWTVAAITAGTIIILGGYFIGKLWVGLSVNLIVTTIQIGMVAMVVIGVCIPRLDWKYSARRGVAGHVDVGEGDSDDDHHEEDDN